MNPLSRKTLAAIVVGVGLLAAACSGSSDTFNTAGKGQVRIAMSTGTGPTVNTAGMATTGTRTGTPSLTTNSDQGSLMTSMQSANVTFSKIQARNSAGTWVDVLIALPVTLDLLSLRDGRNVDLPVGYLPPGTYDALTVTITQVDIVMMDTTKISITPPAGGWTAEFSTKPFVVVDGQPTSIHIMFREDMSFHFMNGSIQFEPEFEDED